MNNAKDGAVLILRQEVQKYQDWTRVANKDLPDWELAGYLYWTDLYKAIDVVMNAVPIQNWSIEVLNDILYVLARDHEAENILDNLIIHPQELILLAQYGRNYSAFQARWQLADGLGRIEGFDQDAESILGDFVIADPVEYVKRRALFSLLNRKSPLTENFAQLAYEAGDETLKHWALWVMEQIRSSDK